VTDAVSSILEIVRIPVLQDNYVWLLRCPLTGQTGVVDPAEAAPVEAALAQRGWTLDWILNTHHHWDHTGANVELKARSGARIVGPARDAARIPGMDLGVDEGDRFDLGACPATVHFVPAHTAGDVAFHFPASRALFCGDTIFLMGCGRLLEGTPAMLWDAMLRLRALPGDTWVYCAHEYTVANARFALTVDPGNPALRARAQAVEAQRGRGEPTVPGLLCEERATNPFMRADDPALAAAVEMVGAPPAEVLGALRARKDRF